MSGRQNILMVAFQNHHRSNGGMESATRIFEALASDFNWTLLTNRDSERSRRWSANGAIVEQFHFDEGVPRWRRGLQQAALFRLLLLRARAGKTDVIHANDIRAAHVAMSVAFLLRLPMIFTIRDTKAEGNRYSQAWHRVARNVFRAVTLSEEMGYIMSRDLGVSRDRLRTINSIVDLGSFAPVPDEQRAILRRTLDIGHEEIALGIVASVRAKKGQLGFLRYVMPAIGYKIPGVRLHLLGDFRPDQDDYARACLAAVEEFRLQKQVIFHGFAADIASWLRALDVVVVSSAYEGLARSMIESMACGVPVISFDVCSAREMLKQTGAGIVVSQGDHAGMAEAVVSLCHDTQKRRNMGVRGRSVAEARFREDRVATAWREVYGEALDSNPNRVAKCSK